MSQPDLKNPDNAKVVTIASVPEGSLASIKSVEQLEEIKERGAAENGTTAVVPGSILAFGLGKTASDLPRLGAQSLRRGDTVYHKVHKEECKVREVDASSNRVRVKFKNGDKAWVKSENIVKL